MERGRADKSVDIAAQIGTYLFLGGATITATAVLLPHPHQMNTTGYWGLCGFMLVLALVIWTRRGGGAEGAVQWVIVIASLGVVTASVYFNGERAGGPSIMNELYYVWPALYVGYFFQPRAIAFTLALTGVAYLWVLHTLGIGFDAGFTRWIDTFSVAAGSAVALHAIGRYVKALVRRLNVLALTDPLTGALNRRGFDERFELELRRARRIPQSLAVAIGDIDHFKRLNDGHGHAAGDDALKLVAELLRSTAREVDAVGRLGGEEFAVLMPATDARGAFHAAERMRRRVASADIALTISFGAAELLGPDEDAAAVIARADAALYEAKTGGRDRTVVSPSVSEPIAASTTDAGAKYE